MCFVFLDFGLGWLISCCLFVVIPSSFVFTSLSARSLVSYRASKNIEEARQQLPRALGSRLYMIASSFTHLQPCTRVCVVAGRNCMT